MGDRQMRPSKFTEPQIVQALRQVKAGTPAVQVCRKLGITQTTFYRWRNKYEGAAVGEVREVRAPAGLLAHRSAPRAQDRRGKIE